MSVVAWFVGIVLIFCGALVFAFRCAEDRDDAHAALCVAVAVAATEFVAFWNLAAALAR